MALDNPIPYYLQAVENQNKNRQDMYQNIAGIGQGIGQGFNTIGQAIQEQKKKQILDQIIQAMQNQGKPQQGPPLPGAGTPGMPAPSSGMGAPPADNTNLINSLMMKYDPQLAMQRMPTPFQQSEIDKNNALTKRYSQMPSSKIASPWRVVPGMLSKNGKPVQQNEQTGEVRETNLDVTPTGRGNTSFAEAITWDKATPQQQALAKGLYQGNIRPYDLGYKDRTIATSLANEYATKNGLPPFQSYSGDVKGGMAKNLAFGKMGMNSLSLNTALGHANSALEAYQNVANTNERFLNVPLNKLRAQTNDPNIIKLQTTLNALSGELATVFKGSAGTDQEIGHWINALSQDLTPSQANGAIQQVNDLLNSRLQALQYQQSNVMEGRPGDRQLISPHGQKLSNRFKNIGKSSESKPYSDPDKEARYQAWKKSQGL